MNKKTLPQLTLANILKIDFICNEYKKEIGHEISYTDCIRIAIESLHEEVECTGCGRVYYWLNLKEHELYCSKNILDSFEGR